jgi:transglutaminase-like putative cysteine protease
MSVLPPPDPINAVPETRRYRVVHRTDYHYSVPMVDSYTVAYLRPRDTDVQTVQATTLTTLPEVAGFDEHVDLFGNLTTQFGVHAPHDRLTIEAISTVAVADRPTPTDPTVWTDVVAALTNMGGDDAVSILPFRAASPFVDLSLHGSELAEIAYQAFPPGRDIIEGARNLCDHIFDSFVFDSTFTDLSTPLGEVLSARRGVCQDFAHLALGCLRSIGLAGRYVSGYLETVPLPGQDRLVGADASHAWCSVWTPHAGWVDFDPTNGHLPVNRHITVAWGRDYSDVTPVRGVVIGPAATQTLDVSVDVAPL